MTFTIRPATTEDQEIILELWAHLIAHHKSIQQVHPRRTTELLPSLIDQTWADPDHERIFIAEEGPRTTGFVRVTLAANGSCDGRIETIYVDARHRRNGVGRALIEAASRWLRERGAGDMCVGVIASNQAAQAFCKQVGFRPLIVTHMASLASEIVPMIGRPSVKSLQSALPRAIWTYAEDKGERPLSAATTYGCGIVRCRGSNVAVAGAP